MTELELKAKAYDLLAMMEACKMELARISAELAKRAEDDKKDE